MTEHHYFAYGSNLSSLRLLARIRRAEALATARLPAHRLEFHMPSRDGSAKCDAYFTGAPEDYVWGVIYRIDPDEREILDGYEGRGDCYDVKRVELATDQGQLVEAFTYYALRTDAQVPPYCWYREHVLSGAREHRLPLDYIARLEATAYRADRDSQRRSAELSIYR